MNDNVFLPSLFYQNALMTTSDVSSHSGKPHIHFKILSQRGFKYHIVSLNRVKVSHIYHVFYMGFWETSISLVIITNAISNA